MVFTEVMMILVWSSAAVMKRLEGVEGCNVNEN